MKGFGTVAAILALIAMIIHVEASSTNSELAKRGTAADWSSCTYSSDCANKCCQKAADGKYYCYSNKPTHPEWDVCTADQVPSPVRTFPDWSGCTYSGQCKNGCCQKAADGNYYCYTNKPSHPEWDQCTDVQANCPAGFWHPPNASDPRKCCSKNSSYAPGTGCYCDPAVYVWSPTANDCIFIADPKNCYGWAQGRCERAENVTQCESYNACQVDYCQKYIAAHGVSPVENFICTCSGNTCTHPTP